MSLLPSLRVPRISAIPPVIPWADPSATPTILQSLLRILWVIVGYDPMIRGPIPSTYPPTVLHGKKDCQTLPDSRGPKLDSRPRLCLRQGCPLPRLEHGINSQNHQTTFLHVHTVLTSGAMALTPPFEPFTAEKSTASW